MLRPKGCLSDLALLGGEPLFERPKSIGGLVRPDFERFMRYSSLFFDKRRYTNNGPVNRLLEQRLAEFHGAKHCITFASAFWALATTMRYLALPGRSEVIIPSLTYRRMAEIVVAAGLVPRYCDVDRLSLAETAATVRPCVNGDTALIVGVHPTVNCCDAHGLVDLGSEVGVPVMFDSVESVYETCGGKRVGSFDLAEGFSMHATKLINGFEGGYITTNSPELAEQLSLRRAFGFRDEDEIVALGFNAKLNEVHASMALASLDDVEAQVERNRGRYEAYHGRLAEVAGLALREFAEGERTSFKNIVVQMDDDWPLTRDLTIRLLVAEGALAKPYYSPALHTRRTSFETRFDALPVTEYLMDRLIWMPCGNQVSVADIGAIMDVLAFVSRHADAVRAHLEVQDRIA